ncbi:rhomboid family intramembrane serine protease GlpG [Psychromonas antarctica]|jgi:GlpG protein|uniref:rhomboid family intramembrane serine protease GlpG n=1 Tax=Psychromonas antarctica TaxID=67573 RepID=UPI001EE8C5DF|nr:rhomboid family intramembrane serine protease GlpG [Psychromonas antarctica]MCG6202120.1 rhomboid family intramembrane serine protease GlpG [Psychromonas antarctica]
MFTLHHFQNLRAAQAFSDYLNALNIKNQIRHDEFDYQLLIEQNTQQILAQKELALFLQNPNDPKYLAASWQAGSTTQEHTQFAYANSDLISNFISHGGFISHAILVVCIVIYAFTSLGGLQPMQSFLAFFTQQPFDYTESWRFITPVFLHFSLLHLVFNLLWWWQLAGIVEKSHGKQRLVLLFMFSAIASNLAQYYLVSPYFGGLSGVVYALVGYCWLFGLLNKGSKVNLPNSYFIFLLFWLMLGFVDLLPVNIANYAHLVGLLAGLFLALISSKLKANG